MGSSNAKNKDVLWKFIKKFHEELDPKTHKILDSLTNYAINYFEDEVEPNKKFKKPNADERKALLNLILQLNKVPQNTEAEEIQTIIYTAGKENGYSKDLRSWFRLIYEVTFGEENGPRMGFFISFFGIKETIDLMEKKVENINLMFSFLRPFIFNLDPETAHDLAIKSLKYNFLPESLFKVENEEFLNTNYLEKKFKNPIGLAAGFDKSAEVYNKIFKLGFGFVEVGTVTPRQQYGNEKPRIFSLERDNALINRLGFNNDGSEIVKKRIEEDVPNGLLGINIGPNKDTSNMTNDFIECAKTFFPLGDYITINISSPNTEGLRDFHNKEHFKRLIIKNKSCKRDK